MPINLSLILLVHYSAEYNYNRFSYFDSDVFSKQSELVMNLKEADREKSENQSLLFLMEVVTAGSHPSYITQSYIPQSYSL